MPTVYGENIEGQGATTDYTEYMLHENGRDILITTSVTTDPSGSQTTVSSWWDNGTVVGSSIMIDDVSGDMSGLYMSEMGGAAQPIIIVGSASGGGTPPEVIDLPQ